MKYRLPALLFFLTLPSSLFSQANDNFASRQILNGDPFVTPIVISGNNTSATVETGEPGHGRNAGGASVWYQWTPTTSGKVRFSLAGSNFDTLMGLYTGTAVNALGTFNTNDDDDGTHGVGTYSGFLYEARAGVTFQIAIDGWNNGASPSRGDYTLTISPAPVGPANDDFADREFLQGTLPVHLFGSTNFNASHQYGEPYHAGVLAAASIWYEWTAPISGRVEINTIGSTFSNVLGVYTGNSVSSLTSVGSSATSVPTVTFDAVAGTAYKIAVDGVVGSFQASGSIGLNIIEIKERVLMPFGSDWQWLHPTDGVDPVMSDADFHSTWMIAEYDGGAFSPAAPGLLGYEMIAWAPIVTNISQPPSGMRYSAYFRRMLTMDSDMNNLTIQILADDGAVIYLDGAEIGRANYTGPDTYTGLADDAVETETTPVSIPVPNISAGQHLLAVSLHNASITSTDLGFDLQLSEKAPSFGDVSPTLSGICTGFEECPLDSFSYLGRRDGAELGWTSSGRLLANVRATTSGKALEINGATAARFVTEVIDLRNTSNASASIDVRTWDSSSGFEATDNLSAVIEGSLDGIAYQEVATLIPLTVGGGAGLLALDIGGGYTSFSTQPGDISDNLLSMRIVLTATANSGSEHIVIDNLCVFGDESSGGVDSDSDGLSDILEASINTDANNPDTDGDGQSDGAEYLIAGTNPRDSRSVFRILSIAGTPTSGLQITASTVAGKKYRLQIGRNFAGWSDEPIQTASGASMTFSVSGPLANPDAQFRIQVEK